MNKRNVGKTEKYKMLNDEMNRMGEGGGGMKKVIVKSVVVDALVAMSTDFEKYFAAIGIELKKNMHKKQRVTVRILRLILGC